LKEEVVDEELDKEKEKKKGERKIGHSSTSKDT
jgi:hypothetical protein